MSIETYEDLIEVSTTDGAIAESEAEIVSSGQLHDARIALSTLRRKHFG